MKKIILIVLVISVMVLFQKCATILTGTKQEVIFKSNANGKVYMNLTEIGETGDILKIPRNSLVKLYTIKADGCADKAIELPIKSNAIFYLNILNGLFVGAYYDLLYDSHLKTDKVINVTLDCKD